VLITDTLNAARETVPAEWMPLYSTCVSQGGGWSLCDGECIESDNYQCILGETGKGFFQM